MWGTKLSRGGVHLEVGELDLAEGADEVVEPLHRVRTWYRI